MQIDATHLWIVPVVTVLAQMAKAIPFIEGRPWLGPWMAVALGLGLAAIASLAQPVDLPFQQALGIWGVEGVLAGLAASGLYSLGGKKLMGGIGKLIGS